MKNHLIMIIWSWKVKNNEHSKPNWSSTSINVTPKHTKKSPNNCSYSNYCTSICTNIGRGSKNRSAKKPAAIRVSGTPNFVKQNIPGKSAGDLCGMFVWPLQGLSDLQQSGMKRSLWITWPGYQTFCQCPLLSTSILGSLVVRLRRPTELPWDRWRFEEFFGRINP